MDDNATMMSEIVEFEDVTNMNTTMTTESADLTTDKIGHENDKNRNALFVLTIVMMLSGCIGNLLVIGAVVAHKPLRVLHNTFIVNLAISDMAVSSAVNASGLTAILTDGKSLMNSPALCEFLGMVCITACISSVLNIAGISINRYVKICHSKIYHKIYNRRTVPWMVFLFWVFTFLIDFPSFGFIGWGRHAFSFKFMLCTYVQGYSTYGYTFFFFLVGFMAPWLASGVAYLKIFLFTRAASRNLQKSLEGQPQNKNKSKAGISETRILRATFTIWCMFLIMWSPYALTILFDRNHEWSAVVYAVAMTFAHGNSSINGIIYGVTNKQFRIGYWKILTCGRGCERGVKIESSGTKTSTA